MADTLAQSYPAVAESVPRARNALVEFAREAGLEADRLEDVRLAASEALSNAVRHAYRRGEPGELHISAALAGDELWMMVGDDGHGLKPRSQSPGLGLGLALIASVSDGLDVAERAVRGVELRMRFGVGVRRQPRGSSSSATSPASSRFSTTT